jgi:4-amino-4-deoxy-L-arabinose transferase-like glycosyltransferase
MTAAVASDGAASSGLVALNRRTLWITLGAILAFRLLAAGLIHLTEDEAYYRLWSLFPQAGYYDHPPMIAWWIWLGRHLVGDNALGVRLLPVLASAATTWLVFDSARLAGASERTAVRAAIWYNATLLVAFGAMLAIPDLPASFFWTLSVWAVLKAGYSRPIAWWCAAGAAAGLATLSKYSSLFLAPGILLFLAITPEGRRRLLSPGPWLAIPVAALLFGVNVLWNAQHGWVSFTKQFGRAAPAHFAPTHVLEFVVAELALLNPLIAVFVGRATGLLRRPGANGDVRPFLAISAPFLLYLLIHSLHDRVQAHWPAPVFPALAIAAAIAAESATGWWARLRTVAPVLGLGVGAAALTYMALPIPSPFAPQDPGHTVRGWGPYAEKIEALRLKTGARWVGTLSYGEAAQLVSQHEIHAPVLQLAERDRYVFLPSAQADIRGPGLVLELNRRIDAATLSDCFEAVTPLGEVLRTHEKHGRYAAFAVARPKHVVDGGCWDSGQAPWERKAP